MRPDLSIMGNVWHRIVGSDNQMTPPHSIDDLLKDFDNVKITNVDAAIEANLWAKRFRDFLEKRDLQGKVTTLKFLVMTQSIQTRSEMNNNSSRKQAALRKEMQATFLKVGQMFFSEESEDILSLSNQVLLESLFEATERVRTGHKLREDDVSNLLKARQDINVMQNGLEPKFMKFLSLQSNSPMACLLSIL